MNSACAVYEAIVSQLQMHLLDSDARAGALQPTFLLCLVLLIACIRGNWEAGRGERDLPLSAAVSRFLSLSHNLTCYVPSEVPASTEFCLCTKINVLTEKQRKRNGEIWSSDLSQIRSIINSLIAKKS